MSESIRSLEIWSDPIRDGARDTFTKNKTSKWSLLDGDTEEKYLINISKPENKNHLTYSPTDIEYSYNSYGFRSEEFTNLDNDILYFGCSFTEGTGSPLNHVWSYQLHEKIKSLYPKSASLQYYSLGMGSLSIDGITRKIYGAIENIKLRPKMIICFFPHIMRQELYFQNFSDGDPWNFIPGWYPIHLPKKLLLKSKNFFDTYHSVFSLTNGLNNFFKNCLFIQSLCEANGIEFRFSSWGDRLSTTELPDPDLENLPAKYITNDKKWISLENLIIDFIPKKIKKCYLNANSMKEKNFNKSKIINNPFGPFKETIARDFSHPCPNYYYVIANDFFDFIKPDLDKIYG